LLQEGIADDDPARLGENGAAALLGFAALAAEVVETARPGHGGPESDRCQGDSRRRSAR